MSKHPPPQLRPHGSLGRTWGKVIAVVTLSWAMAGCLDFGFEPKIRTGMVKDEGGTPCFTISMEEERNGGIPELWALTLGEETGGAVAWSFMLPKTQPLPSNACIRYGEAPAGAIQRQAAKPLKVGKIYDVWLNASPNSHDHTYGYDALFCVIALPGGGVKIHQIAYDGGWRYEACGPLQ